MAIHLTTGADLDFPGLQRRIHEEEDEVVVRLIALVGKTESGHAFNAHIYESVDDSTEPFSQLFVVTGPGGAAHDPVVQAWLASHPGQHIRGEGNVHVSGSLTNIAVVR
jgi:hypothetical protein